MYLVESRQILSQSLGEASVSVVPQQGAVPPVLQGGLVGHVPDAQVLGLDVIVARALQRDTHSGLLTQEVPPAKDPHTQPSLELRAQGSRRQVPSSVQIPPSPADNEAPPPKQPLFQEIGIQSTDFCLSSSPAPPPHPHPFCMLCSSHTLLPTLSQLGAQCHPPCSHHWWPPLQTQTCCNWPSCRPPLGSQPCCPADWTSDHRCTSRACGSHAHWPPGSSHHPQKVW